MPISRAACKGCAVAGAGDRGGGLVSTEIVYMIQVHGGGWVCWGGSSLLVVIATQSFLSPSSISYHFNSCVDFFCLFIYFLFPVEISGIYASGAAFLLHFKYKCAKSQLASYIVVVPNVFPLF